MQDAIKNESNEEEHVAGVMDDQLMQGLGQIQAPIEMQNQIEQQLADEEQAIKMQSSDDGVDGGQEQHDQQVDGQQDEEDDDYKDDQHERTGGNTPHQEELDEEEQGILSFDTYNT